MSGKKEPCQNCGKEITTIKHIRKRHTDACIAKAAEKREEPAKIVKAIEPTPTPIVEEVVATPEGGALLDGMPTPGQDVNPDVAKLVAIAKKQQDEFRKAPEAFVGEQ